jgi:hypothetical protein
MNKTVITAVAISAATLLGMAAISAAGAATSVSKASCSTPSYDGTNLTLSCIAPEAAVTAHTTVTVPASSDAATSSAAPAKSDAPSTSAATSTSASPPITKAGNLKDVSTAAQLTAALAAAKAGDTIALAAGTYSGDFNATASGTATAPITLTGGGSAVLNGGAQTAGYTFSLGSKDTTAAIGYWKLSGFTVTGGSKGVVWDHVSNSSITGLKVHDTGEEGIHLRDNSSNDTIQNSTIAGTGQIPADEGYGEGIYIGSAVSHWIDESQNQPDHSDNVKLLGNSVSTTGAENVDIKEGTHGGVISGNSFNGTGMCYNTGQSCNSADSFIDMKGEGWLISGNTAADMHAVWQAGGATDDGYQVHNIPNTGSEGSGTNNTFSKNSVSSVGGYGFNVTGGTGNVVTCNNTVTGAGDGFANVSCKS